MFPPTITLNPACSSIRPVSVVVVDLPLVPVIAMIRPASHRDASSTSPITGTPAARAAAITGCSGGTPGLNTMRSASANVAGWCPPSSTTTPSGRSASASGTSTRTSVNVTRPPRAVSNCAAAMPLLAPPTTVTCIPATLNTRSPQLQRRQAEQRKNDPDDHEPGDDLRLAPADQLEVVMERRHPEHAAAGQLE